MSALNVTADPMTRREFLNYAWLASLGFVFLSGVGGSTFLFAFPRFKPGQFGGTFQLPPKEIPGLGDPPKPYFDGLFWLVNLDSAPGSSKAGILALYKVCVHLGCLYDWQPSANLFHCPCHGSMYQKDGTYIDGPAPRSADRMVIRCLDAEGRELAATNERGDPLPLPEGTVTLAVETGKIIQGQPHG